MQFSVSLTLAFVPLALSSPVSLDKRAAVYCGSQYYSDSAVSSAAAAACSYVQSGTDAGSSTYPHTYNNYEGFVFPVGGPYDEFPILASGSVYSGGSPGADRVVINENCDLAGVITHTGASGNNFVGCDAA